MSKWIEVRFRLEIPDEVDPFSMLGVLTALAEFVSKRIPRAGKIGGIGVWKSEAPGTLYATEEE